MRSVFVLLIALGACMTTSRVMAQGISPHSDPDAGKEHQHNGRLFAGGAVSFWADSKEKSLTLDFCPEVGYLFNDDWGMGMLLAYAYEQKETGGVTMISNAVKVSPFVRYYYYHKSPFNLYLDAGGGFNFAKEKSGSNVEKHSGFEVGIRPGACIDLTEGLCLCLRMGFVGYRDDYFMGEEPQMGSKGFGLRFAPEELMVGLELEF